MSRLGQYGRSLAFGLAAAALWSAGACAQAQSIADRIQTCGVCHGADGNSPMADIPSLAGQPEFFILNQLFLMREGVRRIEPMVPLVKDLKDEDLSALAGHYAKLPPKASDEKIDPELVKRGAELAAAKRCVSCHGATLAGQEQMPRLARQRVDYLIYALKAIRDGQRTGGDTIMSGAVAGLSDADLAALAHYAASH
jgi:cytochrome c553